MDPLIVWLRGHEQAVVKAEALELLKRKKRNMGTTMRAHLERKWSEEKQRKKDFVERSHSVVFEARKKKQVAVRARKLAEQERRARVDEGDGDGVRRAQAPARLVDVRDGAARGVVHGRLLVRSAAGPLLPLLSLDATEGPPASQSAALALLATLLSQEEVQQQLLDVSLQLTERGVQRGVHTLFGLAEPGPEGAATG